MKMRNCFFAAASVVLAASCVKENAPESSKTTVNYVSVEFASELEVKTSLSGNTVNWLEGDKISVFDNSASADSHNNPFETVSVDGVFTGSVPEDADEFYALYPYRALSTLDEKVININLPAEQNAVVGSFADDLAIMVAKADNGKLSFKNVCSHIKFTLAEGITGVKSITLMGNNAEILAGPATVDMSGTEPAVSVSVDSGSETYVTLRNSDNSDLTSGDYYFTVLPVTFEQGFTVILSKTDGTQVAKKTSTARNELASRNGILEMKPLAASGYSEYMNYFVKYNDGFDLTFGGVTINKSTHSGGILVSDNKKNSWNTATNEDGVFFIDPNCTKASVHQTMSFDSFVVIGADSLSKSKFVTTKIVKFKDKGSLVMFANLDCNVNGNNGFIQDENVEGGKTFGKIIISGCRFTNMTTHLFNFKSQPIKGLTINIENTDFAFGADGIYLFNLGTSSIDAITFRNNVYYSALGTQVTECKLVGGDNGIVTKLVSENGTYDKVAVVNGGLCRFASCEEVQFLNNIFVDCIPADATKASNLMNLRGVSDKTAVTGSITNNFYYTSSSVKLQTGMSKDADTGYTGMDKNNTPAVLNDSPLSGDWDPANGVYGAYLKVTYGTNGLYLPSTAGASRPDMTQAANSASYGYPATDLGSF